MKKIAIRTKKGGVGKSTTAANIGYWLSKQGKRVCLVDIDSQFNLTTMLGYAQNRVEKTLIDYIRGDNIDDVAVEIRDNLYLIPSSSALADVLEVLRVRPPELTLRFRMQEKEPYEYMIFDCPPGESPLITNVLCYVEEVWAPLQTQYLSLEGLRQVTDEIESNNRDFGPYGVKAQVKLVVPTMFDGRTNLSFDVLKMAEDKYNVLVSKPIRRTVKLEECPSYGKTIFEYDPKGNGAKDYMELGERILSNG